MDGRLIETFERSQKTEGSTGRIGRPKKKVKVVAEQVDTEEERLSGDESQDEGKSHISSL